MFRINHERNIRLRFVTRISLSVSQSAFVRSARLNLVCPETSARSVADVMNPHYGFLRYLILTG